MSSKLCLLFRFSDRFLISPHACCRPRSSYLPLFDLPKNIWWSVQVMKLLMMQCFPCSCRFSLLATNILLSNMFSNTLNICSSLSMTDQISHLHNFCLQT
jgi:hypothetical protein